MKKGLSGKKHNILFGCICIFLLLAISAGLFIYFSIIKRETSVTDDVPDTITINGNKIDTSSMISSSGTTVDGMLEEECDLSFLTTSLYIEEVYISSGDSVTAGDKLLKISENSIEEARAELEDAAQLADLDYRAG